MGVNTNGRSWPTNLSKLLQEEVFVLNLKEISEQLGPQREYIFYVQTIKFSKSI